MSCARCEAMEKALRQAVNRLHNQGGEISEITHEANLETSRQAEAALAMAHVHPAPRDSSRD